MRLGYFCGKSAQSEGEASAFQVGVLQLYEIFNLSLHP